MHATDIVGWTTAVGAAFCTDHRPRRGRPIFAVEEGWEGITCDHPHNDEGEPLACATLGEVEGVEPEEEEEA